MTEGKAITRYHIILKKCIEGQPPVMTAADVGEKKYMLCLGIIQDRFGIQVMPNGERKMRKGGGQK